MLNNKNLRLFLTPSWLVNVIGISAGIIISGGAIILAHYSGSELRQQIFEVQSSQASTATTGNYQAVTENFANNSFLGALPLLLTWAAVGLTVYFVASAIVKMLGQAAELKERMDYVHASKDSLMKEAITHLCIRLGALLVWFIFIKLTISVIIPYALAASYAAAHEFSLQSVLEVGLAVGAIYLATWVHAIFLRLIVLKPRLFGGL